MPDTRTPAPPEVITRNSLPLVSARAAVTSINVEARTVELVWSTGAKVRRFDWNRWQPFDEELSMEPGAVRMDRLNSGAALLNTHFQLSLEGQIGVVEEARLQDGQGWARVRFSKRADVEPYWQDVVDGIIRNVSVGYIVHAYQITEAPDGGVARYLAIDWEPYEISLVPVPADADAGIRSADRPADAPSYPVRYLQNEPASQPESAADPAPEPETRNQPEDTPMPQTVDNTTQPVNEAEIRAAAIRQENERQAQIRRLTDLYPQFGGDFSRSLLDDPACTIHRARELVLERLADQSGQNPTRSQATVQTVQDETETRRRAMGEAIFQRSFTSAQHSAENRELARQFRGMNLADMARECVEQAGGSARGLSRPEIIELALNNTRGGGMQTTSDFPVILANVANRSMMRGYQLAGQTFWPLVNRGTLADFKEKTFLQIGNQVELKEVNEAGEFEIGVLNDAGGERLKLRTFGRIINISRQVIINDELGVFNDLSSGFGRSAANLESNLVWGMITGAPRLRDGKPLFHADHSNIGTGGVINIDAIDALDQLIGMQTEPGTGADLNLHGKYILAPRSMRLAAQRAIGFVSATKVDDLNPMAGEYDVITEPRLQRADPKAWYLAAEPAAAPTIEIAYLEGQEGLYTAYQDGFEVDGVSVKARLDVGVALMDYRWIAKNPGAK
ncbi:prohead protease/major capsid protein fusion protein [Chromobacterium violaceum]|uniref:prohead protease/major capsid protein fusion protein n=1 Tax=Chromobacterium violaceum TaxID=536 RepID=UPI0015FB44DB|nr:prohead protease/major capsid protein fusion protein [Chromobacterium violaceum]MBA8734224.1 Mu-like prophage major head subunit gpT family protein [Chromobacterium violaceum]